MDSPSALDLKLKKRATASNSVEVLFTVRESTKVKEKGSRSDASQLASDDLDWAPLTSPFSVDSPLTLDLKVRASVSKLVDGFLSSYHSKKVDSKYSSLVTRVRPRLGTITSLFSVDSTLTLDLGLEALRSKTSKTFFQLEKKRHRQFFQFLSLTNI